MSSQCFLLRPELVFENSSLLRRQTSTGTSAPSCSEKMADAGCKADWPLENSTSLTPADARFDTVMVYKKNSG